MTKPTTDKICEMLELGPHLFANDERQTWAMVAIDLLRELERENEELRRLQEMMPKDDDAPASDPGLAYSEAIRLERSGAKP